MCLSHRIATIDAWSYPPKFEDRKVEGKSASGYSEALWGRGAIGLIDSTYFEKPFT